MKEKLRKLIKSQNTEDQQIALNIIRARYSKFPYKLLLFIERVLSLVPIFMFSYVVTTSDRNSRIWKVISIPEYLMLRYAFSGTDHLKSLNVDFDTLNMQLRDDHTMVTPTAFGAFICAIITKRIHKKEIMKNRRGELAKIF